MRKHPNRTCKDDRCGHRPNPTLGKFAGDSVVEAGKSCGCGCLILAALLLILIIAVLALVFLTPIIAI